MQFFFRKEKKLRKETLEKGFQPATIVHPKNLMIYARKVSPHFYQLLGQSKVFYLGWI
jgi:hypothetical protein